MSFSQWFAMPSAERNHRKLMYLADKQADLESLDEAQREAWIKSVTPASDTDFGM